MTMERHVLVVLPHPDDESAGPGGSLVKLSQQGVPITYLCGTLGQMGRNMGRPIIANRETLPLIRERELREACRLLGVQELRLMGLRDKTLEFEDPEALADLILPVIKELRPSRIYTYYPGFALHPDHNALGAATVIAVRRLPSAERPVIYAQALGERETLVQQLGEPDVDVDVTDVLPQKMAALKAHRTQMAGWIEKMEARMATDADYRTEMEDRWKREQFYIYGVDDEANPI